MRRVVITGLGTINPLGPNLESSFPRWMAGESGVGPVTRFDVSAQATTIAACVDWDASEHFRGPDLRKLDPFTMWALVASDEALRDAGLDEDAVHDIVHVVACFIYMNRLADGLGVGIEPDDLAWAVELFGEEAVQRHLDWADGV